VTLQIEAYAVRHKGGMPEPFVYERDVGPHDVQVRITHCSVARGDVQFMNDDWGDARFPLVPGHEIVGIVEEAGSAVPDLQPGDRVGIGYQQAACFACHFCEQGTEQFCPGQEVIGVHAYGGWAERIVVDSRFAFALPARLDSARSAPLLSSGLTVFAAILRARLPDRSRVAVLGVGGLGHLAIQFLSRMGHGVSALSHAPEKRSLIEGLGGTYVDASDSRAMAESHRAFDFILSTLNVPFDLNAHLRMLGPQGQLCMVATPLSELPLTAGHLYDCARRSLYGSYVGSRADTVQMLAFAAAHGVEAVVEVMPFRHLENGIQKVRRREVPIGLVLEAEPSSARAG
jgi:D-arabinose 1-dehydrogenase-like Zn-dependent alcohol dehydrogenase